MKSAVGCRGGWGTGDRGQPPTFFYAEAKIPRRARAGLVRTYVGRRVEKLFRDEGSRSVAMVPFGGEVTGRGFPAPRALPPPACADAPEYLGTTGR